MQQPIEVLELTAHCVMYDFFQSSMIITGIIKISLFFAVSG